MSTCKLAVRAAGLHVCGTGLIRSLGQTLERRSRAFSVHTRTGMDCGGPAGDRVGPSEVEVSLNFLHVEAAAIQGARKRRQSEDTIDLPIRQVDSESGLVDTRLIPSALGAYMGVLAKYLGYPRLFVCVLVPICVPSAGLLILSQNGRRAVMSSSRGDTDDELGNACSR
ncbi:unnamed protein product [Protopolystoma xenopodis]|uniref:Uncharacterized protein n=1 Tax=Protopolystoma xenopodis TaxID=117903 RepID=A0A448XRF5_9PLAT|nr:unnamed protein product [Protopolystoma xenopodis]